MAEDKNEIDLFGEMFPDEVNSGEDENSCCAQIQPESQKSFGKKGKKAATGTSGTSTPAKSPEERAIEKLQGEKLPSRTMRCKMYNEFFDYEAAEDNAEPNLEDVRQFMIGQGFHELEPARASLSIITPEGQEQFVLCSVRAEKMG